MTTPEKVIQRESIILRVLWMLLFLLVWHVAVPLLGLLVVAQLLYRLFYGAPSAHFMSFGDSLSQYLAQIGRFAVFNTDAKPWPVADWPQARAAEGEAAHVAKSTKAAEQPASAVATSVAEPEPGVETETETETELEVADADLAAELSNASEVVETSNQLEAEAEAEAAQEADPQSTEQQPTGPADQQVKDESKL